MVASTRMLQAPIQVSDHIHISDVARLSDVAPCDRELVNPRLHIGDRLPLRARSAQALR
jgi:hypothetical protein